MTMRLPTMPFAPTFWLFVRLALGFEWLRAGWEKLGDPGWTDEPRGAGVEGFLKGAIAKATQGEHPEVQHWFHDLAEDVLLPNAEFLGFLVTFGELAVGLALVLGFLTRLSVLFGAAMNLMFLFAGTTSINPQMLLLGVALAALGAGAGTYGVDRWVLPWLARRTTPALARTGKALIWLALAIVGVWFTFILADTETWLTAVVVAAIIAAGWFWIDRRSRASAS